MTKNMKITLENAVNCIIEKADKERYELYNEIVNKSYTKDLENIKVGDFYINFIYPFEEYLQTLLENKLKLNDKQKNLFMNAEFFDRHFTNLFQVYEGNACCADKSRTLLNKICQFLVTGDKIEFNYDQQYTYHLPKRILNNHDEILKAYEALNSLIYGEWGKYIEFINSLPSKI